MIGAKTTTSTQNTFHGIRPVNLQTDLAPLADLIELVFAQAMDDSGRAAIREMRYLSKMGLGLSILGRLNDLALGISNGFVWVEDNKLVGNVSIYPASLPSSVGSTWIIANVGVHPSYQRRGIARKLMQSSMELLRRRGVKHAILQVDVDNAAAIPLYETLGFIKERAFTTWTRSSYATLPKDNTFDDIFITRRRSSEWQAEYGLASTVRPAQAGGIGWLKPLQPSLFHASIWQQIIRWFAISNIERLIIRSEDQSQILSSLWVENSLGTSTIRLTMMTHPDYQGLYDRALLNTVLRRFRTSSLIIEHPADDEIMAAILQQAQFRVKRSVWHMRWDVN